MCSMAPAEAFTAELIDPELTPTMELSMDDEPKVQIVTVMLNAPVEIPNSVYVTVTDNKAHTYRKFWNGEPLVFVLPNRNDFVAYATNFVTETGKLYVSGQKDKLTGNVEITFTGKTGIELVGNILGVYTNDYDWYVNTNKLTGNWGANGNSIESVEVDEIIMSDADGFENTKNIASVEPESIFAQANKFNKFENGVVGATNSPLLAKYPGLKLDYSEVTGCGRITVSGAQEEVWDGVVTIGGLTNNVWMTKYGNVYTDCEATNFVDVLGLTWGDLVTVKFLDQELVLPVVPTYSYVDSGKPAIILGKTDTGAPTGYVSLAINMGNFAETYGIAFKGTDENGDWFWTAFEGVSFPIEIKFEMLEFNHAD